MVTDKSLNTYVRLYPRLKDIRELSVKIAIDVGEYFFKENLATFHPKPENMELYVRHRLYDTVYEDLINKEWNWPEEHCRPGAVPLPELERTSMDEE
ncbi:hypothetical protein GCK32_014183 [Trichostrongylus colubriformis]|uniref:Uncharacterized protein n=1 Tax=Trichostrongylus colubriformis TaxID=6319 RepID=A0AAN8IIR1_TRICO